MKQVISRGPFLPQPLCESVYFQLSRSITSRQSRAGRGCVREGSLQNTRLKRDRGDLTPTAASFQSNMFRFPYNNFLSYLGTLFKTDLLASLSNFLPLVNLLFQSNFALSQNYLAVSTTHEEKQCFPASVFVPHLQEPQCSSVCRCKSTTGGRSQQTVTDLALGADSSDSVLGCSVCSLLVFLSSVFIHSINQGSATS